jgi:ATP-dependent Clp protease ATP-binding subunit ClpX
MTDAMFELPSDENTKTLEIDGAYSRKKFEKSKFKKLKVA